ncbi:hypothetical protein [Streptomyces sp. PanSC9]|uniref:hypothetical protein n=1 Tax=Streptomyces sp. PanSC9 TaxID=1520461 RepID=UPI000F99B607|nr:hypothetical protein [Streptomyces sp. PanSC9]ROP48059.1 hypothetical protein EDD94_7797 [Streptomyces sp. PanSC9]
MIAPDAVIVPAHDLSDALTGVYGQVKRLEQGKLPARRKPCGPPAEAQHGAVVVDPRHERGRCARDLGISANAG